MNGRDYGQLAEDDFGLLSFQGTRYHAFERHKRRVAFNNALSF